MWLSTKDVRVGVVPSLGGRVLSLVTPAGEHLFSNADLLDEALHPVGKVTEGADDRPGRSGAGPIGVATRLGLHPRAGPVLASGRARPTGCWTGAPTRPGGLRKAPARGPRCAALMTLGQDFASCAR